MAIYDCDRILTTHDDILPMIEIDEIFSSQSLNSDLQFLIKLSFNWFQTETFKTLIEETINTSHLKNKSSAMKFDISLLTGLFECQTT